MTKNGDRLAAVFYWCINLIVCILFEIVFFMFLCIMRFESIGIWVRGLLHAHVIRCKTAASLFRYRSCGFASSFIPDCITVGELSAIQ